MPLVLLPTDRFDDSKADKNPQRPYEMGEVGHAD